MGKEKGKEKGHILNFKRLLNIKFGKTRVSDARKLRLNKLLNEDSRTKRKGIKKCLFRIYTAGL